MNRIMLVSVFSLVTIAASAVQLRRLPEVMVAEGETVVLGGQNSVGMQSANSTIATVTPPDGNKSVLSGVRLGHTEITYADDRGPFAVQPVMVVPTYWDMLKKFFEDDPEVNIGIVGDKVVVAGQTANVDTLRRLDDAKKLDTSRLVVQVTYSATALSVLVKNFLDAADIKGVDVKVVGREVCLSGRMYDKQSIEKADKRVRGFLSDFPGVSVNTDGLKIYKQKIVIDIEFLSYNTNKAKNLGIQPPKNVVGTFESNFETGYDRENGHSLSRSRNSEGEAETTVEEKVDGQGSKSTKTTTKSSGKNPRSVSHQHDLAKTLKNGLTAGFGVEKVSVTVNMLKENQVAKQLYSTQLSTQSGEPAEFQSGGTRYKVFDSNQNSTTTRDIEHGFIIRTTPVILDSDTVNLDFELDHSTVGNWANNNDTDDFDLKRYRTKSKYIIRPGESIVLSGFNQVDDSLVKTGWPFLSRIPFIGEWLFGNRSNERDDTEMLLVVTVNWAIEDDGAEAKKRRDELRDRKVDVEMP